MPMFLHLSCLISYSRMCWCHIAVFVRPVLHKVGIYITYVARHVTQYVNVYSKILVLFGEELFENYFPFEVYFYDVCNNMFRSNIMFGACVIQHCRNTRSDSKVMRLIFFWLYWQYCSLLTQTAVDLYPSSVPTCSVMALQSLIVE